MHTKMSLNVRHRVVSPAGINERTASLEIRLKLSEYQSSPYASSTDVPSTGTPFRLSGTVNSILWFKSATRP